MKKLLALALSLAASSLVALGATRSDMLVSTDWLAQHLNDSKLVLLHVSANRTAYDAGHIPGARFVALGDLAVTRDGIPNELPSAADLVKVLTGVGVSDDSRVILYGDTSVLPATRAYFTLDYLGHGDQAALLDGGLDKWKSESKALSKDAPASNVSGAMTGTLTARVKPAVVVPMDEVKKMASTAGSATLLDVRSANEFKTSHIPASQNAYWMDSQLSKDNQTLKSESDLRKILDAAGVSASKPVVTYCNSGMQASQSYFTLKYLGYDVRMYDGSMSEWNAKGGPIEKASEK